jgi:hypothetical protein
MIKEVGTKKALLDPTGARVIGYFKTREAAVDFQEELTLQQIKKEKEMEREYRYMGLKRTIWTTK